MYDSTTYSSVPASSGSANPIVLLVYVAFIVLIIASVWKIFTKAGRPGWAALIPFYNTYIMLKIAGRPGWWLLLMLVPLVNFIVLIIVYIDFAKAYGRSAVFGIFGLLLFSFIGFPMLAFGKSQYVGVNGVGPGPSGPTDVPRQAAPVQPPVPPTTPPVPPTV